MSAGSQVQPMTPQQQQQQQQPHQPPVGSQNNQDSNLSTGSSHSDKETESVTPDKLTARTAKRKRKVFITKCTTHFCNLIFPKAVDEAGVATGKNSRNLTPQETKKIDAYFAKQQGASPVRHGGGGAKSPSASAQSPYPMVTKTWKILIRFTDINNDDNLLQYPPSSPQPAVGGTMPELGNLMQPPRTPIGPAKTAPRPSTQQQQQQQPPTTRSLDLENASELELRNKLVEVFRVSLRQILSKWLTNVCFQSNDELRHQLGTSQKTIEQHKSHIDKCIEVVKKLLKEKSSIEKKEARHKCMQNRLRLGQFVTQRVGATFQENWTDGYAFQELARRQEEITTEREEIDRQKKLLLKKRPPNDTGRKRNCNPPGSQAIHNGTCFIGWNV